jgi:hypothetical protein
VLREGAGDIGREQREKCRAAKTGFTSGLPHVCIAMVSTGRSSR